MARGNNNSPALANQNGGNDRPANRPMIEIKATLEASMDRIQAALPRHMTAARMTQVVSTLVFRTPKLQECHPHSILAAVMRACSLGLDLEPAMNEAFLIPRWNKEINANECQFQIGYQGLRKLACQGGQVTFIVARPIYPKDEFRYAYNPDLVFTHIPATRSGKVNHPDNIITGVYGYAKLATGDQILEVMTKEEVDAVKSRSQTSGYGPWVTDYVEMSRKTVIKRLCKSLPRSYELAMAIDADNDDYRDDSPGQVRASASARGVKGLMGRMQAIEQEPEFSTSEGVQQPLRSEDEPVGMLIDSADDEA